jgi:hypothetical protein
MHAKGDSRFAAQLDSGIRCLETALKKRYACLFIALLFAFGMTNSHAEELASDPPHARSNPDADISRIAGLPEPDDEAVRRIRTGEEWTNPSIAVNADGYDLIVQGEPGETRLNLADLETALLRLPAKCWPLGRVVIVSENGVRSTGDEVPIRRHLQAVKGMLESHRLRVELWPSA